MQAALCESASRRGLQGFERQWSNGQRHLASNQDDAGSTPAWRTMLEGTKRHDTQAQTKTEERVVNSLWGVMAAWRTFNPFGRGSIPRRGTMLLSFNGKRMALCLKGVGARFLIEIMRVRVAPGLPISLRDRPKGRTAGFDPADLGSNPSPSANLVQVSGVNG